MDKTGAHIPGSMYVHAGGGSLCTPYFMYIQIKEFQYAHMTARIHIRSDGVDMKNLTCDPIRD